MITLLANGGGMVDKVATLWPEIVVVGMSFFVMIIGLSPSAAIRKATLHLSALTLIVAAALVVFGTSFGLPELPAMHTFLKLAILLVGLLLLGACAETPAEAGADPGPGEKFHAAFVSRGEFYGFFLMSLAGAMLCVSADDLMWLFLALELTSLPTYVMVATAREKMQAPEAGVKYFFLGAFAAAIFLYGFTLLYGATGTTTFSPYGAAVEPGTINHVLATDGVTSMAMLGLLLSVVGLCFKVAAVPMHSYAADVYQGAATSVTAFLAFVPKAAGFVALIAVLNLVGWPLDATALTSGLFWLVWVLAVATMFVGNTLALRQTNVKRVLAYSSIAHSGYMMVGLLVGPGDNPDSAMANGIAAVLFYLVAYGVMNLGAFAVLGILRSKGQECETYDDLRGLVRRHPGLATVMAVCVFSLTGLPPILGFWGKVYLVGAAVSSGFIFLVILTVLASAIGAVYYLRIIAACFLPEANESTRAAPGTSIRVAAAGASALLVVVLSLASGWLLDAAHEAAGEQAPPKPAITDTPVEAELSAAR